MFPQGRENREEVKRRSSEVPIPAVLFIAGESQRMRQFQTRTLGSFKKEKKKKKCPVIAESHQPKKSAGKRRGERSTVGKALGTHSGSEMGPSDVVGAYYFLPLFALEFLPKVMVD